MKTLTLLLLVAVVVGGIYYYSTEKETGGPTQETVPENHQGSAELEGINTTLPNASTQQSTAQGLGAKESQLWSAYNTVFLKPTGAIISNPTPISWCPNSCIGCDMDVTSEAIGRAMNYAARSKDKATVDKLSRYYYTTMRYPGTNHMMWKLNSDGTPGSCGGQNSAVDAELEMIEGLGYARRQWTSDAEGRAFIDTERMIMDSLADGRITTIYGQTLPFCLYPTGTSSDSKALPCENTAYIGYLNLNALKEMCSLNATWCETYTGSKALANNALQKGSYGTVIYTSFEIGKGLGTREHYIHNLWVLKHVIEDSGRTNAVAAEMYDTSRAVYYGELPNNGQNICSPTDTTCNNRPGLVCEKFEPNRGCVVGSRPGAYAEYLEMASALKDTKFATDLATTLAQKCFEDGNSLCNPDNFGNIEALQGFAAARAAGYVQ